METKAAAITIQKHWKAFHVREQYRKIRQSALVIQSYFRMIQTRREYRVQLEQIREEKEELRSLMVDNAVVLLQNRIRGWLARKRFLAQRGAALKIQAFWRGHKQRLAIREAWGKKIQEVQNRLSLAHKNATEDKKLCNRTSFALDYLYKMRDMSYLIEAVNSLGKFP